MAKRKNKKSNLNLQASTSKAFRKNPNNLNSVSAAPVPHASFNPPISIDVYNELKRYGSNYHFTLLRFVSDIELKQNDYSFRENIRNQIAICLLQSFPQCQASIFGSSKNGIGFNGSDLDIVVDIGYDIWNSRNNKAIQRQIFSTIDEMARCFKRARIAQQVTKIGYARVPLVKFQEPRTGIEVDVSFKNALPIYNTDLISVYCNSHDKVRPFMMIIKYWAKMQKVSGSAEPNILLTSYGLSLMMLFFLMNRPDPIIPCVGLLQEEYNRQYPGQQHFSNGWECSFLTDASRYTSRFSQTSILQLIFEFFDFYGNLNFESWVICPLMGRLIPKRDFKQHRASFSQKYLANFYKYKIEFKLNSPVCLQDPFELCNSVSGAYRLDALKTFQIKCLKAAKVCNSILKKSKPLVNLFQFISVSKLAKKTREKALQELHKKVKAEKNKRNGAHKALMKGLTPVVDSDENSTDSDESIELFDELESVHRNPEIQNLLSESQAHIDEVKRRKSTEKRNVKDKNLNYKVYTKSELKNIFNRAMSKFKTIDKDNNSETKESEKEETVSKYNKLIDIWDRLSLEKFKNLDYSFCLTVNINRMFILDEEGQVLPKKLIKFMTVNVAKQEHIRNKRFLNQFLKFVMKRIFKWSVIKESTVGNLERINSNFIRRKFKLKNKSRFNVASDTKSKSGVRPDTKIQTDAANLQVSLSSDSQIKISDSLTTYIPDSMIKIPDKKTNNLDAQVGNEGIQSANLDLDMANVDLKVGTIDQDDSPLKRKRYDSYENSEKIVKKNKSDEQSECVTEKEKQLDVAVIKECQMVDLTENSKTADKSDVEKNETSKDVLKGEIKNDEIENREELEQSPENAIPLTWDETDKDTDSISLNEERVHTDGKYILLQEYSIITSQNVWKNRLEMEKNMEYEDDNDCVVSDEKMVKDESSDVPVVTVQDDKLPAKNLDENLPHPLTWEFNLSENIISNVSCENFAKHAFKVKVWKDLAGRKTFCIVLEPEINDDFDREDFDIMFKCFSKVCATSACQIFD